MTDEKVFRKKSLASIFDVKMLGQIFLEWHKVTEEDIEKIKKYKTDNSCSFGEACIQLGFITYEDLARALAVQTGYEYRPPDSVSVSDIDTDLCDSIGWDTLKNMSFIPLQSRAILVYDPYDIAVGNAFDQKVSSTLRPSYETQIASFTSIQDLIGKHLSIASASKVSINKEQLMSARAQIDEILGDAVTRDASDVHFKPTIDELHVEFRLNGFLVAQKKYELLREQASAVIVVLKTMFNMDVVKHYIPQDGSGSIAASSYGKIDLRASIQPTIYGESMVIRILKQKSKFASLDEMGHSEYNVRIMKKIMNVRDGLFLITGPTGSGKTTSLYAALQHMGKSRPGQRISTLEDPVEYKMDKAKQVFIQSKEYTPKTQHEHINTFDKALRAEMRQDPDIMLVGEIRDAETADLAIRAALTGHYVFSTLHTRSALSAIIRLEDLGVRRVLIAETVVGLMAQRLVPKVCTKCRRTSVPTDKGAESLRRLMAAEFGDDPVGNEILEKMISSTLSFVNPNGCQECNFMGYGGRVPVAEVLPVTDKLRFVLLSDASMTKIREVSFETGFRPMIYDVALKVAAGDVDPKELKEYVSL